MKMVSLYLVRLSAITVETVEGAMVVCGLEGMLMPIQPCFSKSNVLFLSEYRQR